MAVGIKDIARIAKVSTATVSMVLNEKPGVGEDTRNRILKIARELDYPGMRAGRGLSNNTDSICFLHIARHGHAINRDHDVFIADYIEGLSLGAKENGFGLHISTFASKPIQEILDFAQEYPASGIIVLGTELSMTDVKAFSALRKPLVFIDSYYKYLDFNFIDMNNEDAVDLIMSKFIEYGHNCIGMVTGSIETPNLKLREDAFVACLARYGLIEKEPLLFPVDPTFHGAYENMKQILVSLPKLPTALFCANDIIACGCLRAFREAGIRVPGDLSLIGFDNLPMAAISDPPLTTIDVSKKQIGRMAVQVLASNSRGGKKPATKVLIGGNLIERASVCRMK